MLASVPALAGTGAERLVDDRLDRARATAACCAAAKAAINVLCTARKRVRGADGVADILVADDVTGTNDHGTRRIYLETGDRYWTAAREAKGKMAF
jgi:xanthine dehydrogenase molybdopterin-binding subunit B